MRYSKQVVCFLALLCVSATITGSVGAVVPATETLAPAPQNPEDIDPRDLQMLAILYIEGNRPHDAIPLLERSIDLYPENGETYMWLGAAQFLTEQFAEAEESFMKALARNPGLTDVRNYLGLLRYKEGDLNGALREFSVALRDPVYPPVSKARARLNIANVYLEQGSPEAALEHLTAASAAISDNDGSYIPVQLQLSKALTQLDRPQEAIAALQKIITVEPDFAEAHLLLGIAYRDLGQARVAREHLEKVIELAPGTAIGERAQAALARIQG